MTDAEADEVLAGRRPDGRADLASLADAVAWLRIESQAADPPPMSPQLQDRLAMPRAGGWWPDRRRGVRAAALSLAAAATVAVGLVASGSHGVLPRPVQTVVADVGDAVGADFLRPARDPDVVGGPVRSPRPDDPTGGDGSDEAGDGGGDIVGQADAGDVDAGARYDDVTSIDPWCEWWLQEHRDGAGSGGPVPERADPADLPGAGPPPDGRLPGKGPADTERPEIGRSDGESPDPSGRDTNWAGRARGGGAGEAAEWCERPERAGR